MSTPHPIPRRGQRDFSASIAIVMRDTNRLLPFRAPATILKRRPRFTLRVNGMRTDGSFDRLVEAVQAIQGRPLGNNYEIYAGDKRVFTFGVCLRQTRHEVAAAAFRHAAMRPLSELS